MNRKWLLVWGILFLILAMCGCSANTAEDCIYPSKLSDTELGRTVAEEINKRVEDGQL